MSRSWGVVVGVDGSPSSDAAVRWAAQHAALRGARLTVAHATTPTIGSLFVSDTLPEAETGLLERAKRLAAETAGTSLPITAEEVLSAPADALLQMSADADLVVVGRRGRSRLASVLLGSVSMALLHHSRCPVGVVEADHDGAVPAPSAPVLVGVDTSPASEEALEWAFAEASRRGVGLVAVHAWWGPGTFEFAGTDWETIRADVEKEFDAQFGPWRKRFGDVEARRVVVRDEPAREIAERSGDAQLVVLGSRRHGEIASALLGSVSSAVVQAVRTPVVVVRS